MNTARLQTRPNKTICVFPTVPKFRSPTQIFYCRFWCFTVDSFRRKMLSLSSLFLLQLTLKLTLLKAWKRFVFLSSLKMISANHRPDYCRDISRNRDSVMISDEIKDSLVSLLKVSCKNIIETLCCFIESQKGRKRSDLSIINKIPAKTYLLKECGLPSAGN